MRGRRGGGQGQDGGRGQGRGGGQGYRRGRGGGADGVGPGAVGECVCPACGAVADHQRGIPCTHVLCPNCGTRMIRK